MAELSVVILSYNTRDLLARCLDCLFDAGAEAGISLEIIVIDNGSTDGSLPYLRSLQPGIRLVENQHNTGFAGGNNQGMTLASHDSLLLLNSDAFIGANTLRRGMEILSSETKAAIVGVRLDNTDGSLQAECGRFPSLLDDITASVGLDQKLKRRHDTPTSASTADWIQGACMFVRRDFVRAAGGLDTSFFMYSEEVEWCRRAWDTGWQVWYIPDAGVVHVGGGSSKDHDLGRRVALYTSRLSFRQRTSGRAAAAALWLSILAGLGIRIVTRSMVQAFIRRKVGRQSPRSDWELLREIARISPLATQKSQTQAI